ncbi:MAG: SPOR domain-containing protein [Pseudomonadota bacterium]
MAVDAASSPSTNGPKSISASGLAHVAGAAISLALLIGVTVWAYQLITRDVSGVPVVRAAEGPVRVQPETPGGAIADHQGLAVNDVAAVGTASRPADRLILAPAPLDLSQDDVVRTPVAETDAAEEPRETSQTEAADVPAETLDPVQLAAVEALANSLANGIDPIAAEDNTPDVAANPVPEEVPEAELAAAPSTAPVEGGLGRSLRPKLRPAGLGGVPQAVTLTSAGPTEDIDPETLPVGTRLAQLGAFASADIAREEWEKLSAKFGDYLAGKSRVIQKATSGGRTFYRLRAAGFEDLSDARRFCSALVAERAECIPVVTR